MSARIAPLFYARVTLNSQIVLSVAAPLVVVTEALARTLTAIEPHLDVREALEIELRLA